MKQKVLTFFLLSFFAISQIMVASTPSWAERDDDDDNGYQGPRALTSSEANVSGGCNCGSTVAGSAGSSALLIGAALGVYVASVITDHDGDVIEVIYEDLVAVVEIEQIGMDLYISVTEVRVSDVPSFISSQNEPDHVFQVITAEEYTGEDITVDGQDVSTLQVIELPPAETYSNAFYVEPGGSISDWTEYAAGVSVNEIPLEDQSTDDSPIEEY